MKWNTSDIIIYSEITIVIILLILVFIGGKNGFGLMDNGDIKEIIIYILASVSTYLGLRNRKE